MARLPTLTSPRIQSTGFSGRQRVQVSADAFGAAGGRALVGLGRGLDRAGDAGMDIALQQKEDVDKIQLLEAEKKLDDWEQQNILDPNTGLLTKKGRDALGTTAQTIGEYEKFVKQERMDGASLSEDNRVRLRALIQDRRRRITKQAARHERNQQDAYLDSQLDTRVGDAVQHGVSYWNDPAEVVNATRTINSTYNEIAKRKGWSDEQVADAKQKAVSLLHSGRIKRMLGDPSARKSEVKEEFNELKTARLLSPEDITALEGIVDKARVDEEGLEIADSIYSPDKTLTEMDDEVRAKVRDPEVMAAARKEINFRDSSRRVQEARNISDATSRATRDALAGNDPAPDDAELILRSSNGGSKLATLRRIKEETLFQQTNPNFRKPTSLDEFYVATGEDLQNGELVKVDSYLGLREKYPNVHGQELNKLVSLWRAARIASGKMARYRAAEAAEGALSQTNRLNAFIIENISNKLSSKKSAQFKSRFDEAASEHKRQAGKDLTQLEQLDLMRVMALEVETPGLNDTLFEIQSDPDKRFLGSVPTAELDELATMLKGEKDAFEENGSIKGSSIKGLYNELDTEPIHPRTETRITNMLKAAGVTPTPSTVRRYYRHGVYRGVWKRGG